MVLKFSHVDYWNFSNFHPLCDSNLHAGSLGERHFLEGSFSRITIAKSIFTAENPLWVSLLKPFTSPKPMFKAPVSQVWYQNALLKERVSLSLSWLAPISTKDSLGLPRAGWSLGKALEISKLDQDLPFRPSSFCLNRLAAALRSRVRKQRWTGCQWCKIHCFYYFFFFFFLECEVLSSCLCFWAKSHNLDYWKSLPQYPLYKQKLKKITEWFVLPFKSKQIINGKWANI